MEKKIITMVEVCDSQELVALVGCTVTAVTGADGDKGEGLCIDCKDEDGNFVGFLITEEGAWHFCDSRRKGITIEQYGKIAMLAGCSDIDTVHFNNADPLVEVVIKPIGNNAADRVVTLLKGIFPGLEVKERDWEFEGETQPMYGCSDPNYYLLINVAVLPESILDGIVGV